MEARNEESTLIDRHVGITLMGESLFKAPQEVQWPTRVNLFTWEAEAGGQVQGQPKLLVRSYLNKKEEEH